jgi:cytochrome c-type biogenesis protein
MPIAVALIAGSLAGVNPCGFPLLPAFLSFYVGTDESNLARAGSRLGQGLLVGALVTIGFLGVFAVIGIPISYGATEITRAVPWAGPAVGGAMAGVGLIAASGRHIGYQVRRAMPVRGERNARTMIVFGAAYAVCSLGCTLPVFLALVGASLATASVGESLVVFGFYGLGMATTLMALSVAAALARDGLARGLKRLLPYMGRVAGGLLLASGAYLSYYWARVLWGPADALSTDPLLTVVSRFSNWIQRTAGSGGGTSLVLAAGAVVAAAMVVSLWQWTGRNQRRQETARQPLTSSREPADRSSGPEAI